MGFCFEEMEDHATSDPMEGLKMLKEQCGHFRLYENKKISIPLGEEEVIEEDTIKEQRSLVGKICLDRGISKEVIQTTMGKIWSLSKSTSFKEVEKNLFIITFSIEAEKQRVLLGKPWLFDNSLFALQPFDGEKQITKTKFNTEQFWVQLQDLHVCYMKC